MEITHEVRSTAFPYDMSAWCIEKSLNLTELLAEIMELLRGSLTDDLREELRGLVSTALFDATKLLAFSSGARWDRADSEVVTSDGLSGVAHLKDVYAISGTLTQLKSQRSLLSSLRALVNGACSPNRTLLHSLLEERGPVCEDSLHSFRGHLESVTMGGMSWEDFQKEALRELDTADAAIADKCARLVELQKSRR